MVRKNSRLKKLGVKKSKKLNKYDKSEIHMSLKNHLTQNINTIAVLYGQKWYLR